MSFGSKSGSSLDSIAQAEQTSLANPITYYFQAASKYPNNSEVWWSMKRPPELGTDAPPKLYLEVFDPGLRHQVFFGATPAPRGHYVLDAFHQDRSAVSNVPGLDVVTAGSTRPRAVAFFAGRVFYAGTRSINFNTSIYFSQVLEKPEQVGDCFQLYDPTSETLRDLLPTDGGVIVIPEVATVFHMQTFGNSLLVFADNGVWRISGSEGQGFKANDYAVTKLSGTPTISNLSFVNIEGMPMWWNRSSINMVVVDEQGNMAVQSITDQTIKTFYMNIPEQSKLFAKGTYDPLGREVQYLYRSESTDDATQRFNYDRVLVMDVLTQAFEPWEVSNPRIELLGLFAISGEAVSQEVVDVFVGADEVLADTDEVISLIENRSIVESHVKYVVNVLDDAEVEYPEPPETDTDEQEEL